MLPTPLFVRQWENNDTICVSMCAARCRLLSCDLIVIIYVPVARRRHISQHIKYQQNASTNTIFLVHEWRKLNHTMRSYCQKRVPILPKKHYCSWVKVYFYNQLELLIPPPHTHQKWEYPSCTISDQSLDHFSPLNDPWFWDKDIHSYSVLWSWCFYCQCFIPSMLRKMTITSSFRHWSLYGRHYNVVGKMWPPNKSIRLFLEKYRPWYYL